MADKQGGGAGGGPLEPFAVVPLPVGPVAADEQGGPVPDLAGEEFIFIVRRILDRRIVNGVLEYYVQWVGFGPEDNTRESAQDLDCPGLIQEFEKKRAIRKIRQLLEGFPLPLIVEILKRMEDQYINPM